MLAPFNLQAISQYVLACCSPIKEKSIKIRETAATQEINRLKSESKSIFTHHVDLGKRKRKHIDIVPIEIRDSVLSI